MRKDVKKATELAKWLSGVRAFHAKGIAVPKAREHFWRVL